MIERRASEASLRQSKKREGKSEIAGKMIDVNYPKTFFYVTR
jgi:hypothetical protein